MVQCALCASRTKETYLRDKYYKLKAKRGAKRAAIAIAHKILVSIYYMIKEGSGYKELGQNYLDKRNKAKTIKYHMSKLESLGMEVLLAEKKAA